MRAFSLVELLIVVALVVIVASFSVPNLIGFLIESQLKEQVAILTSDLRLVASDSKAGWRDDSYGIYFEKERYVVYRGPSYVARAEEFDRVVALPSGLQLETVLTGSSADMAFNRKGKSEVSGSIKISHQSGSQISLSVNGPIVLKQEL